MRVNILLVSVPLWFCVIDAAADDYAEAVDAVARQIDEQDASSRKKMDHGGESNDEELTTRREFEEFLQERYPGSYAFYLRLVESDKAEALVEFNTSHSIARTRRLIMERFLKR